MKTRISRPGSRSSASATAVAASAFHERRGAGFPRRFWLLGWLLVVPALGADDSPLSYDDLVQDPAFLGLGGADQQSTLFAQEFIQTIREDRSPRAAAYRRVLDAVLAADMALADRKTLAVAEKLVATMSYLATTDRSFRDGAAKVIGLVGVGPESLRRAVRSALLNYIRREGGAPGSETLQRLGSRIAGAAAAPPSRDFLAEVVAILWEVDGRTLIHLLVEGLQVHQHQLQVAGGYVAELRELLRIDFATPAEWQAWWNVRRSRSLEAILAEAQIQADARRTDLWRKTIQRLKDPSRPARYLDSLIDSFALLVSREQRIGVLAELGTFPLWLDQAQATPIATGERPDHSELLRRAVLFLLEVLRGEGAYRFLCSDIHASALACLGSFSGFFNRDETFAREVAAVLARKLEAADLTRPARSEGRGRRYDLELLRASASLRLGTEPVRAYLEGYLDAQLRAERPDPELLAEAVAALGRLVTRETSGRAVELFLDFYELARGRGGERAWRSLRKNCVTALNVPIDAGAVRDRVSDLYEAVLARSDDAAAERIPAINGLGILAAAGDLQAVVSLTNVLRDRARFERGEVNAVINALAYLGDRDALAHFLEFLVVDDRAFAEQVWSKTLSILRGGDVQLVTWFVDSLERSAFERDYSEVAGAIVRVALEPSLVPLFELGARSTESAQTLQSFWRRGLALVRSHLVRGEEREAVARLEGFSEASLRNESVRALLPGLSRSLDEWRALAAAMLAARRQWEESGAVAAEVLERQVVGVLSARDDPLSRWCALSWLSLRARELQASPGGRGLVHELHALLSDPARAAAYWNGFQETTRQTYLRSLSTLAEVPGTTESADGPDESGNGPATPR